jgi:hypothetical protein
MYRDGYVPTFTKESNSIPSINHLKQIKIMRKVTAWIAMFGLLVFMSSCDKSSYTEDFQLTKTTTTGNNGGFGISPDPGATRDSVRTTLYFEERLLSTFLMGLSPNEISYVIGKHVPTSTIYTYSDLHQPAAFVPVTDDINFNPIWREWQIDFNPGFTPYQFTSSAQIDSSLHAAEITVTQTDNFYRYIITGKG